MNEDPDSQSPQMPPEDEFPAPPPEPRPFMSGAAGFLSAAALAAGISILSLVFLPLGFVLIVLSGPIAGLILWGAYRNTKHYFARGALVFGIVSFVTVGVCFVGVFSSL